MTKFIIKDWAGNAQFGGRMFNSFDDAWEYLLGQAPDDVDDEYYSEYWVVEAD